MLSPGREGFLWQLLVERSRNALCASLLQSRDRESRLGNLTRDLALCICFNKARLEVGLNGDYRMRSLFDMPLKF